MLNCRHRQVIGDRPHQVGVPDSGRQQVMNQQERASGFHAKACVHVCAEVPQRCAGRAIQLRDQDG